MMRLLLRLGSVLSALLSLLTVLPEVASGDVVVLNAVKDATLISEDEKKANGAGVFIFSGNTDGGDQRRSVHPRTANQAKDRPRRAWKAV